MQPKVANHLDALANRYSFFIAYRSIQPSARTMWQRPKLPETGISFEYIGESVTTKSHAGCIVTSGNRVRPVEVLRQAAQYVEGTPPSGLAGMPAEYSVTNWGNPKGACASACQLFDEALARSRKRFEKRERSSPPAQFITSRLQRPDCAGRYA